MPDTPEPARAQPAAGGVRSVAWLVAGVVVTAACAVGLWSVRHDVLAASGWATALAFGAAAIVRNRRKDTKLVRQVTEMNAQLEHEVELYRHVFETSLDLILVTDRRGTFVAISPSCTATLGYRRDEMIGRTGVDFIYPDDLEPTRSEMRLARRGRDTRNFPCRYMHKDGYPVPLAWTGV